MCRQLRSRCWKSWELLVHSLDSCDSQLYGIHSQDRITTYRSIITIIYIRSPHTYLPPLSLSLSLSLPFSLSLSLLLSPSLFPSLSSPPPHTHLQNRQFNYDCVLQPSCSQLQVYSIAARPLVQGTTTTLHNAWS